MKTLLTSYQDRTSFSLFAAYICRREREESSRVEALEFIELILPDSRSCFTGYLMIFDAWEQSEASRKTELNRYLVHAL